MKNRYKGLSVRTLNMEGVVVKCSQFGDAHGTKIEIMAN